MRWRPRSWARASERRWARPCRFLLRFSRSPICLLCCALLFLSSLQEGSCLSVLYFACPLCCLSCVCKVGVCVLQYARSVPASPRFLHSLCQPFNRSRQRASQCAPALPALPPSPEGLPRRPLTLRHRRHLRTAGRARAMGGRAHERHRRDGVPLVAARARRRHCGGTQPSPPPPLLLQGTHTWARESRRLLRTHPSPWRAPSARHALRRSLSGWASTSWTCASSCTTRSRAPSPRFTRRPVALAATAPRPHALCFTGRLTRCDSARLLWARAGGAKPLKGSASRCAPCAPAASSAPCSPSAAEQLYTALVYGGVALTLHGASALLRGATRRPDQTLLRWCASARG